MASDFDPAEFVDSDFQAHKSPQTATATSLSTGASLRAPTREELDIKVAEAQQKLAEMKHQREGLERERAEWEETRRRQSEFQTGRQEMIQNLTRGLGLLEEAEFTARHEAEQMAKALADFRDALAKIEAVREERWNMDNFSVELTRALTAVENARMEWNTARLKFPLLSGQSANGKEAAPVKNVPEPSPFAKLTFGQMFKLGVALTLPLTVVAMGALAALLVVLLRH